MSSVCISQCVKDTRVPVRASYVNLYKRPESEAEFVMKRVGSWSSTASVEEAGWQQLPHRRIRPTITTTARVVDSVSCRQMYLRSYTFSRKETMPQKTKRCLGRVKDKVGARRPRSEKSTTCDGGGGGGGGRRRYPAVRRVKDLSCAALCAMFRRLLSCTATVDVVD